MISVTIVMIREPPGRTGDQFEFAVAKDHGRRHRRQRPLARPRRVGGAADKPIGIRSPGLCGEIVELIVEKDARPLGDKAEAIGEIQSVGVGNRIAVAVHNRKMRRLVALIGRRIERFDLGGGLRARSPKSPPAIAPHRLSKSARRPEFGPDPDRRDIRRGRRRPISSLPPRDEWLRPNRRQGSRAESPPRILRSSIM